MASPVRLSLVRACLMMFERMPRRITMMMNLVFLLRVAVTTTRPRVTTTEQVRPSTSIHLVVNINIIVTILIVILIIMITILIMITIIMIIMTITSDHPAEEAELAASPSLNRRSAMSGMLLVMSITMMIHVTVILFYYDHHDDLMIVISKSRLKKNLSR